MSNKTLLCFIDDDRDFEIFLFDKVFSNTCADVLCGTSLQEVREHLGDKRPDLFVLDLYFPIDEIDWEGLAELERTFLDLKPDKGDLLTAYNNYQLAENRYIRVANARKQSPDGGLQLAATVARDYPDIPIVFYSRKATFHDIVRCMTCRNVHRVIRKPGGANKEEITEATQQHAQRLCDEFRSVIALHRQSEPPDTPPQPTGGHAQDAARVILESIKWFLLVLD